MSSSILQKIENKYGGCRHCSERDTGCKVNLSNLKYIALKGEELVQHSEKICDCFIFDDRNTLTVHLVELKSKSYHASDIREKFENGLKNCLDILKAVDSNNLYRPTLILVASAHRPVERRMVRNIPIVFNDEPYHVITKKCGLILSQLKAKHR